MTSSVIHRPILVAGKIGAVSCFQFFIGRCLDVFVASMYSGRASIRWSQKRTFFESMPTLCVACWSIAPSEAIGVSVPHRLTNALD